MKALLVILLGLANAVGLMAMGVRRGDCGKCSASEVAKAEPTGGSCACGQRATTRPVEKQSCCGDSRSTPADESPAAPRHGDCACGGLCACGMPGPMATIERPAISLLLLPSGENVDRMTGHCPSLSIQPPVPPPRPA